MMKPEALMSARENVHQLVDTLPEEQLDDVLDYLAELQDGEEPLSAESQAAIEEGLDDIRNGRTIPLEEYRRTRGL
jgi:predicted transcriptional regulator